MTATSEPDVQVKATPFTAWLQSREGGVWTSADTVRAANHVAEVERLALALIQRAERRAA